MLHITQLDEADLSGIMDSLFAAIEEGQWLDAFPKVFGVSFFYPEDIDDLEEHPDSFRGQDHAIACRSVEHPALHAKMVQVVRAVIRRNNSEQALLSNVFEHAGTHYAVELALYDRQYVPLYADFLYSNDLQYECYQSVDFMRVVRRWGWCSETYYLLLARWLAGGEHCSSDILVLDFRDNLRKRLNMPGEIDDFLSALAAFLMRINYRPDNGESDAWISERLGVLVREYIYRPCNFVFPENTALAQALTGRFSEVLERVGGAGIVAESTEDLQPAQDWEDIPEI